MTLQGAHQGANQSITTAFFVAMASRVADSLSRVWTVIACVVNGSEGVQCLRVVYVKAEEREVCCYQEGQVIASVGFARSGSWNRKRQVSYAANQAWTKHTLVISLFRRILDMLAWGSECNAASWIDPALAKSCMDDCKILR